MSTRCAARRYGQVLGIVFLLSASVVQAATWTVAPGGSIEDALLASSAGDTVLVECGTYLEDGLVLPDGVALLGQSGHPDCVTIAGDGSASILTCEGPAFGSRVVGITFTLSAAGASSGPARGGGVFCDGASPRFTACHFDSLRADYGGAVYVRDGSPLFTSCDFRGNSAVAVGGALACVGDSRPRLEYALLVGNDAGVSGSAVNAALDAVPELVSCTLDRHFGVALAGWAGAPALVTATIISGGGKAFLGDPSGVPDFGCTDIYGNSSDWTGLIAPQEAMAGNFSARPFYCVDGTYNLDVGSPCAVEANPVCGYVGARGIGCDEVSGVEDPNGRDDDTPRVTGLSRVYPNPFNPRTTVQYDLQRSGPVEITVYDVSGRRIRTLVRETVAQGAHETVWIGDDARGRQVAAGVYLIRLKADGVVDTKRVVLVK